MDLKSIFNSVLSNPNFSSKVAQATGTDESAVANVIKMGGPLILGQMAHNASTTDGANALHNAAQQHASDSALDDPTSVVAAAADGTNKDGASILGHVFGGSKSGVVDAVAQKTGLDSATVSKILTFAAPLVLAYLGKQMGTNATPADTASTVQNQTDANGNPLSDILTQVLGSAMGGGHTSSTSTGSSNIVGDVLGGLFGGNKK